MGGTQEDPVIIIYFISLANAPIDSNNRNFVRTLAISTLRIQFFCHVWHTTNRKGNNFLPLLCLSILLVTGRLVVTVGGVVLGELTVAGNKDEKDVILQGAHDS